MMEPWEGYDKLDEESRRDVFLRKMAALEDAVPAERDHAWALCAAVCNHEAVRRARKQRFSAVMQTVAGDAHERVRSWSSVS